MTSVTPLWRTVLDDLTMRLESGEFDSRFPTDRELIETYSVSRHTVREAVRRLQLSGKVTRHPGRGSFVESGSFEQPLGTVYSVFESVEATGAVQKSIVLTQEVTTDRRAAAVLDMDEDAPLFYLERVRLADDQALAHDRVWVPADRVEPLIDVDFTHTALYREMRDHCQLRPESGREVITPVNPEPVHAGYLHIGPGQPVFKVERRTHARGRPLELRITLIRGDRYRFVADWDSSDGLVVARMVAG